jgi:hypothetical protein
MDIGNAYLEAYTTEKVYIIAGPEFGERARHLDEIEQHHIRVHSCLHRQSSYHHEESERIHRHSKN